MSRTTARLLRIAGSILFGIYLAVLVYFLFFAEGYGRVPGAEQTLRYNLRPFAEIRRFWIYRKELGNHAWMMNIGGNVIAFLPFGFFLPFFFGQRFRWHTTTLCGFLFSLTVECIQLVTRVGCFDVDDLLLNTAGACIGYLLFALADKIRRRMLYGKKI